MLGTLSALRVWSIPLSRSRTPRLVDPSISIPHSASARSFHLDPGTSYRVRRLITVPRRDTIRHRERDAARGTTRSPYGTAVPAPGRTERPRRTTEPRSDASRPPTSHSNGDAAPDRSPSETLTTDRRPRVGGAARRVAVAIGGYRRKRAENARRVPTESAVLVVGQCLVRVTRCCRSPSGPGEPPG